MTTSPVPTRTTPTTRPGLRLGIAGAVLLIVALLQLSGVFTATTADDVTGTELVHLGMAALGVGLVVAGLVRSARR